MFSELLQKLKAICVAPDPRVVEFETANQILQSANEDLRHQVSSLTSQVAELAQKVSSQVEELRVLVAELTPVPTVVDSVQE